MNSNKFERFLLLGVLIINLIALIPIVTRKKPIKDWIFIYLYNAVTNVLIDKILSKHNILKYPVRFFPKSLKIQILFDFLTYPTLMILYNQMTFKDKPLPVALKVLYFTIPMTFIEYVAVKKTELIKWDKGWNLYHTFIAITLQSLHTRLIIGIIRSLLKSDHTKDY